MEKKKHTMSNYIPLMAVLGFLAIAAIVGVIILACTVSITKVANENGFGGKKVGDMLFLTTTVEGIIKGRQGVMTEASPEDITNQLLTGFTGSVSGEVTSQDTILSAIEKLSSTSSEVNSLIFIQDNTTFELHFNEFKNRAVVFRSVLKSSNNFELDIETGFVTFTGKVESEIQVTYVIVLQLPDIACVAIQHFISKNPNSTWMFASPDPAIDFEDGQTYVQTPINEYTAETIVTVILTSKFKILPQETFALCANIQSTNSNTSYRHISCFISP